ncbi:amidase [Streptomyces sp. NPDC056230]|uniref:amidase n=1 Tax=Streptomyces sp. NPDC056230 TaxID=3345754 RepID=UPI0035D99A10
MGTQLDSASISELRTAMRDGTLTSRRLVESALSRVDSLNPALNAVVVLDAENARRRAAESDDRYQAGTARPLEGIPFTVKDSYLIKGLTAASGSPAFESLIGGWDAFTVEQLKNAGAILIGKTNMPPMADGGMQRGAYGRSESPFNPDYLPAAYASGSSHGSAVSVATGMGVFGMGEETVSSGRSPASNNGICAYTPSRGVLSLRGNWPLFPTRDVIVPHTRSIADMLEVLNVLVVDDPECRGDFWRQQRTIRLPAPSEVRPDDYLELAVPDALHGVRLAVPRRYLGNDATQPIDVHADVLALWESTRSTLEALGAEIVEVDLPLIDLYEQDSPSFDAFHRIPGIPDGWAVHEFTTLVAVAWDEFLRANADPRFTRLAAIDRKSIFPVPDGQLPDRYAEVEDNHDRYRSVYEVLAGIPDALSADGCRLDPAEMIPEFAQALKWIEQIRKVHLEDWLQDQGFDALVFPANADVGPADADTDHESADLAWRNGTLYSHGNNAVRHLGIPTVTTSMGIMPTTGMPVGVTFATKAYRDSDLLAYAYAYEQARGTRPLPTGLPSVDR